MNQTPKFSLNDYDYVITLGGDGTFLTTAHYIRDQNIKILGINSDPCSSLGYLCPLKIQDNMDLHFKKLATEDYNVTL